MSNSVNFNTLKKQYLTTTLPDKEQTTILVSLPSKKLLEELTTIKSTLSEGNQTGEEIIGELYSVIAKVMSCNKMGVTITKEKLESCLEFEDLIYYFHIYLDFVSGIASSKN